VIVPPQDGKRSIYLKCTTRAAHDWPALGVAVSLSGDRDGVREANVVISAATERAMRAEKTSTLLAGRRPSPKLFKTPAKQRPAKPISSAMRKLGALQAAARPRLRGTRLKASSRHRRRAAMNQITPIRSGQVGRSIPRLEATSRSPAASNTSTPCACRACCRQARAQHGRAWPHQEHQYR